MSTQTTAYDEGKEAYGADVDLKDCPHLAGAEKADWERGWKDAEKRDPLAFPVDDSEDDDEF